MKKVFLAVLVAGLFVACGNKNTDAEVTDSTAVETEVVETEAVEEQAPEATAEVAEQTTTETTTATAAKTEEPKVQVEATEDGSKVKVGKKAEISIQPKQTKGNNF